MENSIKTVDFDGWGVYNPSLLNTDFKEAHMKRIIALAAALALVGCIFSGCGSSTDGLTVFEGRLTVATSPDFAPYEFYTLDENGKPALVGFDMALARYIADYMGLELEIVPMDFDGTITELSAGKVDLGMAGYSPDPAREGAMDFSEIYYSGDQCFLTNRENAALFTQLSDANSAAYQIGAQLGSIQADLALEHTPSADIVQLSKVNDIIAEVLTGKLDGAIVERVVAESYLENYPDLVILFQVPYEADGNVVGVRKGNTELLEKVNEAIAAAKADGSLDRFVTEAVEMTAGR